MADQTDSDECCICLNHFHRPKILDCQHVFCFACLKNYVDKTVTEGHFLCPLCRCDVMLPEGGVDNFLSKTASDFSLCDDFLCNDKGYEVETKGDRAEASASKGDKGDKSEASTSKGDKLGVCESKGDKSEASTSTGDKSDIPASKRDKSGVCESKGDKPGMSETRDQKSKEDVVLDTRDLCPCQRHKKVDYLCSDCSQAICYKCFVSRHNGHRFLDLHEEDVKEEIRDELRSLNDELQNQIMKLEKFSNSLNADNGRVEELVNKLCDQIDQQVTNVCSEVTEIGEDLKLDVKKIYLQDATEVRSGTKGFMQLLDDVKLLKDNLIASVKRSACVLKDSSIVQVLERIPAARQEETESCSRKMVIPAVPETSFQAAPLDITTLTKQLGVIIQPEKSHKESPDGYRQTPIHDRTHPFHDRTQPSQYNPLCRSLKADVSPPLPRRYLRGFTGVSVPSQPLLDFSSEGMLGGDVSSEGMLGGDVSSEGMLGGDVSSEGNTVGGALEELNSKTECNEKRFKLSFDEVKVGCYRWLHNPGIRCNGGMWWVSVRRWYDDKLQVHIRLTHKNITDSRYLK